MRRILRGEETTPNMHAGFSGLSLLLHKAERIAKMRRKSGASKKEKGEGVLSLKTKQTKHLLYEKRFELGHVCCKEHSAVSEKRSEKCTL